MKKADDKKLLDKFTYGELLDELEHIWRKTAAEGLVRCFFPYWIHPFNDGMQILEELGLSEPIATPAFEPKPKGRPKKETRLCRPEEA